MCGRGLGAGGDVAEALVADLLAALRLARNATANMAAYIRKHEDRLPPVSHNGAEIALAKIDAAIAKAEARS